MSTLRKTEPVLISFNIFKKQKSIQKHIYTRAAT